MTYQAWTVAAFEQPSASKWNILGTNDAHFNTEITALQSIRNDGWIPASIDSETWTYASADSPTFTFTISGDKTTKYYAGMRIRISQSTGGTKYFIVTRVSYSAPNTTVTIYGGTDYTLNNETISSPYYSREKAPAGFPLTPAKWTVETTDTAARSQTNPVQNTWYNPGSLNIVIPIGVWDTYYEGTLGGSDNSAGLGVQKISLSTANNSESSTDWTCGYYFSFTGATGNQVVVPVHRRGVISLTSKTTHYLVAKTEAASDTAIEINGSVSKTIIRAVCAYL